MVRVSAVLPMVTVTLPFTDLKLVGRTDEILYDRTENPVKYWALAATANATSATKNASRRFILFLILFYSLSDVKYIKYLEFVRKLADKRYLY
jgi:hypothetical protein